MAIGRGFGFASTLICYCCAYAAAAAVSARVAPRGGGLGTSVPLATASPLIETASGEFDLNGLLLKRLIEMCLEDDSAAPASSAGAHRCDARHLVRDAKEIGFGAEHGLAFYRLVNFCGSERRLGECAALTAGLARQLLLGEDAGVRFRSVIDSLRRTSPQIVADAALLLTAQPAAAGDGSQRRRRREDPTAERTAVNCDHADDDSTTGPVEAAATGGARRKRSVSPFMLALYARYSQPCGGGTQSSNRPSCPTGSTAPSRRRTPVRLAYE